jgi:hypothetical protein
MKRYFILSIGLFLVLFSFNSCKEDIELVGDFKETAVIYGLLDQSDSTHIIKINRAFIGPGNAIEFAKIPDSSYFSSVNASITEYVDKIKTGRSWILKDTLVDNKSTNGIFYAPTEKLYYFKDSLNELATYKLEIIIYKGSPKEFKVTGETDMVHGIISGQKQFSSSFDFVTSDNKMNSASAKIAVSNTGNASVINASLKINFNEYQGVNLYNSVNFNWNAGESTVSPNSNYNASLDGSLFYELIKKNVTSNTSITNRKLKSITIIITGGSEEFNNYINANKPSSSLAQSKPIYTNLKVNNGNSVVGIFSSRQTVTIVKQFSYIGVNQNPSCLSSNSRKELCTGNISKYTSDLLFCSDHNLDANQLYHCQ